MLGRVLGACHIFEDNIVSWLASKQKFMSRSSVEAEYILLALGYIKICGCYMF